MKHVRIDKGVELCPIAYDCYLQVYHGVIRPTMYIGLQEAINNVYDTLENYGDGE